MLLHLFFVAACEKSVACSTCHVYLEEDVRLSRRISPGKTIRIDVIVFQVYDRLEEPSDDENDMLDLAFSLSDT